MNRPDAGHIELILAHTKYDRFHDSGFDAVYDGTSIQGSLQAVINANEQLSIQAGVDLTENEIDYDFFGAIEEDDRTIGSWIRLDYEQDAFQVDITGRYDNHSEEGDAFTYRIGAAAFLFDHQSKIFSSVGTAFRAPSLYELYGPFGNEDLDPDESLTFEIGHTTWIHDHVAIENVFFHTEYDERILFQSNPWPAPSFYVNDGTSFEVQGVESRIHLSASEELPLDVVLTHTWQEVDDPTETAVYTARNPEQIIDAAVSYQWDSTWLRVHLQWVDEREDTGNVTLDSYTLVNVSGGYDITSQWSATAAIENITDEEYALANNYATPGLGVKLSLNGSF